MTDLDDLLNCPAGRANYAKVTLRGSNITWFVYAYMTEDRYPLMLAGFSLEDVRIRRDIELEQTFRRVPPVGSVIETEVGDKRLKSVPVKASECCNDACRSIPGPVSVDPAKVKARLRDAPPPPPKTEDQKRTEEILRAHEAPPFSGPAFRQVDPRSHELRRYLKGVQT